MDLGSFLLILALLVLVGLFISRPLFELNPSNPVELADQEDHELSTLLAERDRILNALQELDFDHALGKIPDEDYPLQRNLLLKRGADILRKLDSFQPEAPADDVEARIEAVIAARRADAARAATGNGNGHSQVQVAVPDDDLEVVLANRRRDRREISSGFCPQCGKPLQKSDRFCPKCGLKLA